MPRSILFIFARAADLDLGPDMMALAGFVTGIVVGGVLAIGTVWLSADADDARTENGGSK